MALLRRFVVNRSQFIGSVRSLSDLLSEGKLREKVQSEGSPLKMSESCINRLKEVAGPNESLRITVESGGCSGFQYNFALDSNVAEDDVVIEDQGVRIIIDNTSLSFLEGAVVDYHSEMIKSSFRVQNNPKAEAGCSCGVSFSVKLD